MNKNRGCFAFMQLISIDRVGLGVMADEIQMQMRKIKITLALALTAGNLVAFAKTDPPVAGIQFGDDAKTFKSDHDSFVADDITNLTCCISPDTAREWQSLTSKFLAFSPLSFKNL